MWGSQTTAMQLALHIRESLCIWTFKPVSDTYSHAFHWLHHHHDVASWPSSIHARRNSEGEQSLSYKKGTLFSNTSLMKQEPFKIYEFYSATTIECHYARIQNGCIIFWEIICAWSVEMMRWIPWWLKQRAGVCYWFYTCSEVLPNC